MKEIISKTPLYQGPKSPVSHWVCPHLTGYATAVHSLLIFHYSCARKLIRAMRSSSIKNRVPLSFNISGPLKGGHGAHSFPDYLRLVSQCCMLDMTTCQSVSLSYLRNVFICLFSFLFQLPFNTHNPHCACSSCLQNHREQERKKWALLFVKHAHAQTITKKKTKNMQTNITKEQEGKGLPRDYCFKATACSLQDTNLKKK